MTEGAPISDRLARLEGQVSMLSARMDQSDNRVERLFDEFGRRFDEMAKDLARKFESVADNMTEIRETLAKIAGERLGTTRLVALIASVSGLVGAAVAALAHVSFH